MYVQRYRGATLIYLIGVNSTETTCNTAYDINFSSKNTCQTYLFDNNNGSSFEALMIKPTRIFDPSNSINMNIIRRILVMRVFIIQGAWILFYQQNNVLIFRIKKRKETKKIMSLVRQLNLSQPINTSKRRSIPYPVSKQYPLRLTSVTAKLFAAVESIRSYSYI